MALYNGVVVYEGPSMIDGQDIVMILTNLLRASKNDKTGRMSQTFICLRDTHPVEAVLQGQDSAVCSDCKHRGPTLDGKNRSCYVQVGKSVTSVWLAYKRGSYLPFGAEWPQRLWELIGGSPMRLGTYGDPAAVPIEYVLPLLDHVKKMRAGHTGYSHTWRSYPEVFAPWAPYLMASVDNAEEAALARSLGYRYFRVTGQDEQPGENEILCSAVREVNPLNCARCRACNGSERRRAPSIYIPVHGAGARNFDKNKEL